MTEGSQVRMSEPGANEDGFRPRKTRPEGWREQAIADGVIADPETEEHPTAAEIAGALHDLNRLPVEHDDAQDAHRLLDAVSGHRLARDDAGRFVLVPLPAPKRRWDDYKQKWVLDEGDEDNAPGVFNAPTAVITRKDG